MVAQEYKDIVKKQYEQLFMPKYYQYSCEVYENYIDIWLIDTKLNYVPSIYIPFTFERFPLKITMWHEDSLMNTQKKIWVTYNGNKN